MISKKHKFIFCHIPKTAGNSIHNVLVDYSECYLKPNANGEKFREDNYIDDFGVKYSFGDIGTVKHSNFKAYYRSWDESIYGSIDDYLKFSVVRNPWDRAISLYFYILHIRSSPRKKRSSSREKSIDKEKFKKIIGKFRQSQFDFINVPSQGGVKADVILKFENLQADFNSLCSKIGIPSKELPAVNVGKHKHYTKYYDDEMNEFILNKYAEDISYFNYEFGK